MRSYDTADAPSVVQSSTPRLLALPPEIRNRIFLEVVTVANEDGINDMFDTGVKLDRDLITHSLRNFCINRQLHSEILPLFYGNHVFRLRTLWVMNTQKGEIYRSQTLFWSATKLRCRARHDIGALILRYAIKTPAPCICAMLKHMEITVTAPEKGRPQWTTIVPPDDEEGIAFQKYQDSTQLWLQPISRLRALSFKLETLKITVWFSKNIEARGTRDLGEGYAARFRAWVEEKVDGIDVPAKRTKIVYEELGYSPLQSAE